MLTRVLRVALPVRIEESNACAEQHATIGLGLFLTRQLLDSRAKRREFTSPPLKRVVEVVRELFGCTCGHG
jgi:hypothetical protein